MAHRHTQFTLNEVDKFEALKGKILNKKPTYCIACEEEAPLTGHKHIHIYVQWGRQVRVNPKKFENAHVEKCFGTPEDNKKYIEKDGNIIWEEGTLKTNVESRFPTIEEVKKMNDKELDKLPIQYYSIVQKIKSNRPVELKTYHKTVTVLYIWGKSGIGKTKYACKYMQTLGIEQFDEVKYINNFWNGISNETNTCLYDDFRDSHMKPSEFINFIDYNIHNLNIKGGNLKNMYRHIFITSIQDPEKIYRNTPEEFREQWLRRMEIVHLE